jgi:sugar phosphate isomerase/epimerase
MTTRFSRRQTLAALGSLLGTSAVLPSSLSSATAAPTAPASFTLCLNMSTIRGHKLGLVKELETAAKAGFPAVEIWIDSLQEYLKNGGTTADLKKRLTDLNVRVENAIGFAPWIVEDDNARKKGVDQLEQEMELLAQIGCKRIATPPVGAQAPDASVIELPKVAERYRQILELSDKTGVVPQLELWGFSKNLNKLSEVMYVAIESGHPSARLLLDVYHLFKGGSSLASLPLLGKPAIEIFHVNDYPANISRQTVTDADRIFPGDGVAPIKDILKQIKRTDRPVILSLEVFNKTYYTQDAQTIANTAMNKMKAMVAGV